jgi:hypothetical protein
MRLDIRREYDKSSSTSQDHLDVKTPMDGFFLEIRGLAQL